MKHPPRYKIGTTLALRYKLHPWSEGAPVVIRAISRVGIELRYRVTGAEGEGWVSEEDLVEGQGVLVLE